MPYKIEKWKRGLWILPNLTTGRILGHHKTKKAAERQLRAVGRATHR